jgi:hypothetical protein
MEPSYILCLCLQRVTQLIDGPRAVLHLVTRSDARLLDKVIQVRNEAGSSKGHLEVGSDSLLVGFQENAVTATESGRAGPGRRTHHLFRYLRLSDTAGRPPSVVYYMVMVKTVGGMLVPGPTQKVILPKAGFTTKVLNASGATTPAAAQPATAEQHLSGQPWLAAGDNSATYGVTRTVLNFPSVSSFGIPADATASPGQPQVPGRTG